jgi:lipopolysaccharide transport system ATP-binding protein
MTRPMIETKGIGKLYRLNTGYRPGVLRERIAAALRRTLRGQSEAAGEDFWALRDVSVSIAEGNIVGLIGRNGAGKSTLLKILSRITDPTEGEAHLYGRVASLLEVGIGFHPELTGRENTFLNGAILGMSREETRRKFDEIVQFAELERFIDTPVKRYSSGMYVRLAFAVAAHLDPDILLVDEVLAVGDAAFQKKCLGKIRSVQGEGRTVVVVSHSMATVGSLCQSVVWLDEGRVRGQGPSAQVIAQYLAVGVQNDLVWKPRHVANDAFGYNSVSIVRGDSGASDATIPADAPIDVVFDFTILKPFPAGRLEMHLRNELGETVLLSTSADASSLLAHEWKVGRSTLRCRIPGRLLAPGQYFVSVSEPYGTHSNMRENVLAFTVSEQNAIVAHEGRYGRVAPLLEWTTERTAE